MVAAVQGNNEAAIKHKFEDKLKLIVLLFGNACRCFVKMRLCHHLLGRQINSKSKNFFIDA